MSRKSSRPLLPVLLMVGAGVALIVVAIASFMALSKPPAPTPTVAAQVEDPLLSIPRATLAEAKSAYDSKSAVFVDVRGDSAYAESHIPGALSIDLADLPARLNELNPQGWIITYCT